MIKKQIVIQGIEGSYHEIAARQYFRSGERDVAGEIDIVCCETFRDVVATVQRHPEMLGLIAIENTIAGSLQQNHEFVRESGLKIIGEQKLRISHCLAALPGVKTEDLEEIDSHPMALLQSSDFLETLVETRLNSLPDLRIVEKSDTASSARRIAENHLRKHAAICSRQAAERYGLALLAEGIESNKQNYTRFLLLAQKDTDTVCETTKSNCDKVSLVFSLSHTVGSLSEVLVILSFYDMNLSKIQSFPLVGKAWQYLFYVDFVFDDRDRCQKALEAVRPLTNDLHVLGEYKAQP